MKKYITFFGLFILLVSAEKTLSAPLYSASVQVYNQSGQPLAGVPVKMYVETTSYYGSTTGTTNSNGYIYLYLTAPGFLESMYVTINSGNYDVLTSQNTSTSSSYYLYPVYHLGEDFNLNDIVDDWEMPLVEKFCPELTLHSGDQGVRPVPVQIMDRNSDAQLDWQDVIVDVYTTAGDPVGSFSPSQIYVPTVIYKDLYPYFHPEEVIDTWIDANNDGCFGCSGDPAPASRILQLHFEWGNNGETSPSAWYSHWNVKMAQHSSDTKYSKGTTYPHLFRDGNDVVIQYWFFYPFNASANRHEGDWEHINVIVNSQSPSQAQIQKVVYYFHHKKSVKDPMQITLVNLTHPKVYVGGYVDSFGMSGHGTHGSYPNSGTHYNINSLGDDEFVDGQGLIIDFDNYSNIIILPNFDYVNNGQNNTVPYIDPNGNNLNWMVYNAFWGYVLSEPSAGYTTFTVARGMLAGWTFGVGTYVAEKWFDLPDNVGNFAPAGPVQNVEWEEKGY